ncbi:MAG: hypothetical protein ACPLXO_03285 [Desulfurella sp.]
MKNIGLILGTLILSVVGEVVLYFFGYDFASRSSAMFFNLAIIFPCFYMSFLFARRYLEGLDQELIDRVINGTRFVLVSSSAIAYSYLVYLVFLKIAQITQTNDAISFAFSFTTVIICIAIYKVFSLLFKKALA